MSSCCDKNPLQRSGISQLQRLLPGLQPSYIRVDEREYEDWIFFADEFSRYLKFYEVSGTVTGNWNAFFSTDISAILGTVAVQNVDIYRRSIKERFDFIRDDDNMADIPAVKKKLNELFSAILTLSYALDEFIKKLPGKDIDEEKDFVFKANLTNLVRSKLAPALTRLLRYYLAIDGKPAASLELLQTSTMTGWKVLNIQVVDADVIISDKGLSNIWWPAGATGWNNYISTLNTGVDESIFGDGTWDEYRRITQAVNHNLFTSIFDLYLQAYSRIVQDAENSLLQTLNNWNAHAAHYTLFLSFLKLFRFAQSGINTITQRHLDFYYKEVLRLKPRDAQPNHAHILVELAKQTDAYALKQGTEFKAGKDSIGKDVSYQLDRETTFNKAKVVSLKSVYLGDTLGKDDHLQAGSISTIINNRGRLFASPIANSNDGNGEALKSTFKEWHPYVNKKFLEGKLTDIVMPNAQIGFAIASHYLFLTEGYRNVFLRMSTTNNAVLTTVPLEAWLTTEKGWYKIPALSASTTSIVDSSGSTPCIQLSFSLPGDAPSITNYNAAVHGGTYDTSLPMLKLYMTNPDSTTAYLYNQLKTITVSKVEIEVKVGLNNNDTLNDGGMKQLILANHIGNLDASKAFLPFGPAPKKGASFIIGHKELFKKKNASFRLRWEWMNLTEPYYHIDFENPDTWAAEGTLYPQVNMKYLGGGVWKTLGSGPKNIFNTTATVIPFPDTLQSLTSSNNEVIQAYADEYKIYDTASINGFIKLQLTGDFGHEWYQKTLTKYLINQAKQPPVTTITEPHEPYTPTIQGITLHYKASTLTNLSLTTKTSFEDRTIRFFHIYPFGEGEQHGYLTDGATVFLMPQFTHMKSSTRVDHAGEFYIGVEKLQGLQSVNILFQVMEGSSDPMLAKPDEHVHWSYLSNNHWEPFDDQHINDATRQLIQSGIISFIIPENATITNTILPSGYLWLRASVSKSAEAVCKLIAVEAQAALTTFAPKHNADNFLDNALPPDTISKLKAPASSIKKVTQPFSSFGGRTQEKSDSFYVRVSERLRHKARAITIWDYEHLVLEAFPSIHKVKCLNHTKFDINCETDEMEYNEVLPGHVTVITIPNLQNRNDANPLRPYTNQNVMLEIEEYLKQRTSCHAKVRVRNPRFEEVWLSFELKLLKGYDDFTFYSTQLKEEITRFLTPWAYNNGIDIQFGGKIHKSVLIDFIEERPYVDYITNVFLHQNTNPDNEDAGDCPDSINNDLEVAEASTARSILVSTPASKHDIKPITIGDGSPEDECGCGGPKLPTTNLILL
jgi:hypothetical protein